MKYRQTNDKRQAPSPRTTRYRGQAFWLENKKPKERQAVVSFTIMAHKKRARWARALAAKIGCGITWDKVNDRHETGLRAIQAYDDKATHHCVVQDDAIICKGFVEAVKEACCYLPDGAPASLYHGGFNKESIHSQAFDRAVSSGASWLVRKGPIWGPAIIYPVSTIEDLVKFYEESEVQNYDRRVMRFYQKNNQKCWYSVPSLVQHRVEGNPSLSGHDGNIRQARAFVGPQNALDVDWSGPILKALM